MNGGEMPHPRQVWGTRSGEVATRQKFKRDAPHYKGEKELHTPAGRLVSTRGKIRDKKVGHHVVLPTSGREPKGL